MGYYADSTWGIKITGNIHELAKEIKEHNFDEGWMSLEEGDDDIDTILDAFRNCNEDTDFSVSDDGLTISGWGGGKMLSLASNDEFWSTLARYCVGISDWRGSDYGDYWRIRLYGDGRFSHFSGVVRYPDDTDDTDE